MKRVVAILAVVILLVGGLAFRLSPLWPGPSLPPGATRLHLATEAPHLVPALGCATAALAPARVAVAGDELVLFAEADGARVDVVWPSGWAAWRVGGRAELVTRDGRVVAREGDLTPMYGGGVGTDDAFHVCELGS